MDAHRGRTGGPHERRQRITEVAAGRFDLPGWLASRAGAVVSRMAIRLGTMARGIPRAVLLCLSLAFAPPDTAIADAGAGSCRTPEYRLLDFWLGEWEVREGGRVAGRNRISAILGGCAISEEWTSGTSKGESLFYFHPPSGLWKQVWVTDQADRPGGLKEKVLRSAGNPRELRFEGEWPHPSGKVIRDRTTLRAVDDGSVRQVIEVSSDAGRSWQAVFEGTYLRAPGVEGGLGPGVRTH